MKLIRKTLTSTGSILATLDTHQITYALDAAMYGDQAINATAQVDATMSDLSNQMPVTVSRSGSTVTVTFQTNHYLGGTADYIEIRGTGNSGLDGLYLCASVPSTTSVTYTSGSSGTIGSTPAFAIPIKMHKTFIASGAVSATTMATPAVSATTLNPVALPYTALILTCSIYSAGTVILDLLQAGMR